MAVARRPSGTAADLWSAKLRRRVRPPGRLARGCDACLERALSGGRCDHVPRQDRRNDARPRLVVEEQRLTVICDDVELEDVVAVHDPLDPVQSDSQVDEVPAAVEEPGGDAAANRVPPRLELETGAVVVVGEIRPEHDDAVDRREVEARSERWIDAGEVEFQRDVDRTAAEERRAGGTLLIGDPDLADLAHVVSEQVVVGPNLPSLVRPADRCEIAADDCLGIALGRELALLEQDPRAAETANGLHVVAHEQDGAPFARNLRHAAEAPLLELGISDGEHLVDDQDLRLQVRRHGEREPHVHPRGVPLHRSVDVLPHPCELDDLVELASNLRLVHAEDRAVQVHVLATRQLRAEPRADLEQRRDAAVDVGVALRRLGDPGEELEQRRLAGAVPADDRDRIAFLDLERQLVDGPDGALFLTPQPAARHRNGSFDLPDAVALAQSVCADRDVGHQIMSTIVRSVRRKKYTPPTRTTMPIAALTSSAGTLGGLVPRSDQRKPSITAVSGFSASSHRKRAGMNEAGYTTGVRYMVTWITKGSAKPASRYRTITPVNHRPSPSATTSASRMKIGMRTRCQLGRRL